LDNARRLAESKELIALLVQNTVTAPDEGFLTALDLLRKLRFNAHEPRREILVNPSTPAFQAANAALALLALSEDVRPVRPVLALAADPAARTRFIHHYGEIRGDLLEAARVLDAMKSDPDPQAAVHSSPAEIAGLRS
jgi:hypothetical protein